MNRGFALYQGYKIYFNDVVVFNGKISYLIAWNCEPLWVDSSELSQVVYLIAA